MLACEVLHNMSRTDRGAGGRERNLEVEETPTRLVDGDSGHGHDRNPLNGSKDYLKDWFNGAGAVPWQDGML